MKKLLIILGILLTSATAYSKPIIIDGSTTVGPIAKSFASEFQKNGIEVSVSESGSGNGVKSLLNGTCDVATSSRHLKQEEITAASTKGVHPVLTIVALDGLSVIVHPSNPIKNLTIQQVSDIYTGKITNWNQVGGPFAIINVIQRESNSGTQEAFHELVIGKDNHTKQGAETQSSSGAVKNRVASTPSAIGYDGLGFVDKSVKALTINGIKASSITVKSNQYKISRPLYFITNGAPVGNVKLFVDYAKSVSGKKIITELGFIVK